MIVISWTVGIIIKEKRQLGKVCKRYEDSVFFSDGNTNDIDPFDSEEGERGQRTMSCF